MLYVVNFSNYVEFLGFCKRNIGKRIKIARHDIFSNGIAGTDVMLLVSGPLFLFRQQTGLRSPLNCPHCTVPNMAGAMII